MKIIIKGRPASKKNSRRNFRRISLPSLAYMTFHDHALYQLKKYKEKFEGKVSIDYVFFQKGRMTQDVDNAICSINDVLQDSGIVADDKNIIKGSFLVISGSTEWSTEIKIYGDSL